ncbi:MAG: hypothetical protein ACR2MO_17630 [Acidimicrobiales bacterium]
MRAGIRTNTEASARAVARALRDHAVDDPAAPRNFSVRFSSRRDDAHLLFWGGCVAARSFDPDRILRSLTDHLGAHLPPPPGLVWVTSLPYVRDGRAVLLPSRFKDDLRIVDRQLRAAGYVAVDAPRALLDFGSAELVVPDSLHADPGALGAATAGIHRRRPEPTVGFGRYPIERWVFVDNTGQWGPVSRAAATRAAILDIVDGIDAPGPDLVATVANFFTTVRATSMYPGYTMAMVDAVLDRSPPR